MRCLTPRILCELQVVFHRQKITCFSTLDLSSKTGSLLKTIFYIVSFLGKSAENYSNSLFLEFLGTSSAASTRTRNVSSVALHLPTGGALLFDCGEGTVRQMNFGKVKPLDLKAVFITHLHGDHIYGLPGLGMSLIESKKSIPLFAPVGLRNISLGGAYALRNFDLQPIHKPQFTEPIEPNGILLHRKTNRYRVYEDEHFTVEAQTLRHSVFCLGYVVAEKVARGKFIKEKLGEYDIPFEFRCEFFKTLTNGGSVQMADGRVVNPADVMEAPRQGRKIVILGDTCDSSNIAHIAQDADVLVHEATCVDEEKSFALQTMHSTAGMAGSFARRISARNLILTHFSPRLFNDDNPSEGCLMKKLIVQAQATFGKSTVYAAEDFWRFKIPLSNQASDGNNHMIKRETLS